MSCKDCWKKLVRQDNGGYKCPGCPVATPQPRLLRCFALLCGLFCACKFLSRDGIAGVPVFCLGLILVQAACARG